MAELLSCSTCPWDMSWEGLLMQLRERRLGSLAALGESEVSILIGVREQATTQWRGALAIRRHCAGRVVEVASVSFSAAVDQSAETLWQSVSDSAVVVNRVDSAETVVIQLEHVVQAADSPSWLGDCTLLDFFTREYLLRLSLSDSFLLPASRSLCRLTRKKLSVTSETFFAFTSPVPEKRKRDTPPSNQSAQLLFCPPTMFDTIDQAPCTSRREGAALRQLDTMWKGATPTTRQMIDEGRRRTNSKPRTSVASLHWKGAVVAVIVMVVNPAVQVLEVPYLLVADEKWRGRGLGTLLERHAHVFAWYHGLASIVVPARQEVAAVWRRWGYEKVTPESFQVGELLMSSGFLHCKGVGLLFRGVDSGNCSCLPQAAVALSPGGKVPATGAPRIHDLGTTNDITKCKSSTVSKATHTDPADMSRSPVNDKSSAKTSSGSGNGKAQRAPKKKPPSGSCSKDTANRSKRKCEDNAGCVKSKRRENDGNSDKSSTKVSNKSGVKASNGSAQVNDKSSVKVSNKISAQVNDKSSVKVSNKSSAQVNDKNSPKVSNSIKVKLNDGGKAKVAVGPTSRLQQAASLWPLSQRYAMRASTKHGVTRFVIVAAADHATLAVFVVTSGGSEAENSSLGKRQTTARGPPRKARKTATGSEPPRGPADRPSAHQTAIEPHCRPEQSQGVSDWGTQVATPSKVVLSLEGDAEAVDGLHSPSTCPASNSEKRNPRRILFNSSRPFPEGRPLADSIDAAIPPARSAGHIAAPIETKNVTPTTLDAQSQRQTVMAVVVTTSKPQLGDCCSLVDLVEDNSAAPAWPPERRCPTSGSHQHGSALCDSVLPSSRECSLAGELNKNVSLPLPEHSFACSGNRLDKSSAGNQSLLASRAGNNTRGMTLDECDNAAESSPEHRVVNADKSENTLVDQNRGFPAPPDGSLAPNDDHDKAGTAADDKTDKTDATPGCQTPGASEGPGPDRRQNTTFVEDNSAGILALPPPAIHSNPVADHQIADVSALPGSDHMQNTLVEGNSAGTLAYGNPVADHQIPDVSALPEPDRRQNNTLVEGNSTGTLALPPPAIRGNPVDHQVPDVSALPGPDRRQNVIGNTAGSQGETVPARLSPVVGVSARCDPSVEPVQKGGQPELIVEARYIAVDYFCFAWAFFVSSRRFEGLVHKCRSRLKPAPGRPCCIQITARLPAMLQDYANVHRLRGPPYGGNTKSFVRENGHFKLCLEVPNNGCAEQSLAAAKKRVSSAGIAERTPPLLRFSA
ncbi:hypothetical protein DIPPA_04697 [Diplonema papillatum]|nr:hypothetical protein DIPPA_04697 [Diplonema papillatum]